MTKIFLYNLYKFAVPISA